MSLGATIVFGNSHRNREKKIREILVVLDGKFKNSTHPDYKFVNDSINKSSIGINQAKEVISFLSVKPYASKYKAVFIDKAEKLTIQAQNALLKILEEPPSYAVIILSSKTEDSLLPTVISRCKKLDLTDKESLLKDFFEKVDPVSIEDLKNKGMAGKIDLAEKVSKEEKEEIIEILKNLVVQERNTMLEKNNVESTRNIELLLEAIKDLESTNVNTRLCLENLFLHLC